MSRAIPLVSRRKVSSNTNAGNFLETLRLKILLYICNMSKVFIYKLLCPKSNEVRYVGKTTNINRRLSGHISEANRGKGRRYVLNWINSLLNQDLKPLIEKIEECENDWQEREQYWIKYYRDNNANLCNICDGGLGGTGTHILTKTEREFKAEVMSNTMSKHTTIEKEDIWHQIQQGKSLKDIQTVYANYTRQMHFQVCSGRVWRNITKLKRKSVQDKLAPRSQFTAKDILNIRRLRRTMYNKDIAKKYKCSTSVIQRITSGKTYTDVH